jgi:hypothetical protein
MKIAAWLFAAAAVYVPHLFWPSLTPGRILRSLFVAACGLAAFIVFSFLRAVLATMD